MPSAQNLPVSVAEDWQKNQSNKLSQWPMSARTNQKWLTKKNSDRKNIQICMTRHLHTERKNWRIKKGIPLEPRYAGICKFTTKIFQTPTQKGGLYKILYKDNQKPSEKRDPTNPFAVHLVNPFSFPSFSNLSVVRGIRTPMLLAQVAVLLIADFLGNLGHCHRPWHCGGKHILQNVAIR